jgi:biopolymer transport protein ExbB/TolQ
MVKKKRQPNAKLEQLSIAFTNWIGTTQSLIVHTIFFLGSLFLAAFGVNTDQVLLILTTVVSLEAIYLSIFIQMTVNRNTKSLEEVEADIDEIQEDVEGLEEDVEEISTDIDEIQAEDEEEEAQEVKDAKALDSIRLQLQRLQKDLDNIKKVAKI